VNYDELLYLLPHAEHLSYIQKAHTTYLSLASVVEIFISVISL